MNLYTDLVGAYVEIPDEGDAGWVRAVFLKDNSELMVLVQRSNPSRDARIYLARDLAFPKG